MSGRRWWRGAAGPAATVLLLTLPNCLAAQAPPARATFKCKDGAYSTEVDAHRACSNHGGVAQSLTPARAAAPAPAAQGAAKPAPAAEGTGAMPGSSCIVVFPTGNPNKMGLRNTCEVCKVAVVNFIYFNGQHSIKKFRVEAKSNIEVDVTGTSSTQVIDDEPC